MEDDPNRRIMIKENENGIPSPPKEMNQFQDLLNSMQESFFEADLDGRLTYIDDYACKLHGRCREEIQRLNYRDYIPPEQVHIVSEALDHVQKSGEISPVLEFDIIRKDGSRTATQTVIALKKNDAGQPIGFFGINRDLTLRKKIKQDLQERKESYINILESLPFSIIIAQVSDSRYVLVNDALCRRTGYGRDEIIGKSSDELNFIKKESETKKYEEILRRTGKVDRMEIDIQGKNGRILKSLISSRLIHYEGQECILTISADISDLKSAQQALSESEKSHRAILKTAPYSITISRASDGCYMDVNDAFCQFYGYTRNEIIGRNFRDLKLFSDKAQMKRFIQAFTENGQVNDMEVKFRSKDGTDAHSIVSARPIRYKGENCLLTISFNIDTLRAAQQALKERDENYRTILKTAPYTIVITKLSDGTYVQVNDAFTRHTGYTPEEALGRTSHELNIYADPSDRLRLLKILDRDGYVNNVEIRFLTKKGEILESLISISPMRFEGEDCIISMTVDINELKKAQKTIKESELRFRTIFETAADPIFLTDIQTGAFIDVNQAACRHLGYGKADFLRMSLAQIHEKDAADPLSYFSDDQRQDSFFYETVHVRRNRSKAIVEVSSRPMMHQGRQVLLSIARDITQRKQAEQELLRYRENLELMVAERTEALKKAQDELVKNEKLAVLGQLTATVSHELRNPLGVIRSSNFFLQRKIKPVDKKTDKHFKRIDEQISLCDSIVADLLEYTRGRNVTPLTQDIAPWLREVVEQFQEIENIDILLHMPENLPHLPHDREKMRRVMINLLSNAVLAVNAKLEKAAENSGEYHPQITIKAHAKNNDLIVIVEDNGIGMDAKTVKRAFEPLFTTRARGTGIGLAIVKKIIDEHGGAINIKSRSGDGSRITLSLPYQFGS